jgi:large subunit ribosomal protein L6
MSRIGRQPISVPDGVTVSLGPGRVTVNGPKGELAQDVSTRMQIAEDDGALTVTRPTDRGPDRALHGLTRSLIANMVEGVTDGFERRLEIQGVGYRGIDKQLVGETASRIRRVRPPEPYKGKGIRHEGEQVRRKVGKRA